MKKLIIILLFIPHICNAEMFDGWSNQDFVLQSILTGLVVVDYFQTSVFAAEEGRTTCIINKNTLGWTTSKSCRTESLKESNFILGEKPSQEKINLMIGSALILNWYAAYKLKKKYREMFQISIIIFELDAVHRNYQNGVRIGFGF